MAKVRLASRVCVYVLPDTQRAATDWSVLQEWSLKLNNGRTIPAFGLG